MNRATVCYNLINEYEYVDGTVCIHARIIFIILPTLIAVKLNLQFHTEAHENKWTAHNCTAH